MFLLPIQNCNNQRTYHSYSYVCLFNTIEAIWFARRLLPYLNYAGNYCTHFFYNNAIRLRSNVRFCGYWSAYICLGYTYMADCHFIRYQVRRPCAGAKVTASELVSDRSLEPADNALEPTWPAHCNRLRDTGQSAHPMSQYPFRTIGGGHRSLGMKVEFCTFPSTPQCTPHPSDSSNSALRG